MEHIKRGGIRPSVVVSGVIFGLILGVLRNWNRVELMEPVADGVWLGVVSSTVWEDCIKSGHDLTEEELKERLKERIRKSLSAYSIEMDRDAPIFKKVVR